MKSLFCSLFALVFFVAAYAQDKAGERYDFNRKYTVAQLKADFASFRKILQQNHPRLYEYTPKREFDHFLDSLYGTINREMTEREFQFFLLSAINKVHCSHTKLLPSQNLQDHMGDYFKAPPFKLWFTAGKVWLRANYTANDAIKPGAEIIAINDIPISDIRASFLTRLPREGMNETFLYNRMNTSLWTSNSSFGLFPGLCDYPVIDTYKLSFKNPGKVVAEEIKLPSISYNDYTSLFASGHNRDYSFYRIDSIHTSVLTVSSFLHSDTDNAFGNFIDSVFTVVSATKTHNLIIDIRGNIGGIPETSVALLTHIMRKPFVYYSHGNGYDDFKKPIPLAKNKFTGKVFFLADGACRSTSGHFLAMVKYYKLGAIIGEEACASFSCNDNGSAHAPPNTQLVFICPESTYSVAVSGMKRGHGIMPDYTVIPGIGDLISGKDTVLQFALKLGSAR